MVWEDILMYPKSITFHFIEDPTAFSLRWNSCSGAVSRKEPIRSWLSGFCIFTEIANLIDKK